MMTWETGKSYRILYESESGQATERTIDIIRVSHARDGRFFLIAFCRLRNEERTFRADRVLRSELLEAKAPLSRPSRAAEPISYPSASIRTTDRFDTPAGVAVKARKTFGEVTAAIMGFGMSAVFVFIILGNTGALDGYGFSSSNLPSVSNSYAPSFKPVQPPSPPKPRMEETTIGGRVLRTYRDGTTERYEVPSLAIATNNKMEAIAGIRIPVFVGTTAIADPSLIARYLEADLNRSGKLSFEELEVFQQNMYREFRYEENELALRPDEFLESGGGDCEDFALYTAGLLRFWGWDPYLGSLGPSRGTGHAVCLSYEESAFSSDYTYFSIDSWVAEDGTGLRPGKYVPIDYDQVGGLTNAVKKGWKLRSIYVPEKAWGLRM